MLQSILSNIAIILLMHLLVAINMYYTKTHSYIKKMLTIFITAIAVIVMLYLPIRIGDYWVDMRFIPLIFLAYIQGWKVAIPTLIISATWRMFMGGPGMIPGIIFAMIGPTLLALALHHRSHLKGHYLEKISVVIGSWLICDVPIIFLMPNGAEIFKNIAVIRSVSFIVTSIVLYTFIMFERQRRTLNNQLTKLADEDPLTQLLNRRKFFEVVDKKITSSNTEYYIAMVDIDYFKQLNDTYGHIVGDDILYQISKIFKRYERDNITIGRYGGEEFIIYLDNTSYNGAKQLLENIRQEIRSTPYMTNQNIAIYITVSIGLTKSDNSQSLLYNISFADKNLYKAKESGRDCLIC